jgi:hypothetical protein
MISGFLRRRWTAISPVVCIPSHPFRLRCERTVDRLTVARLFNRNLATVEHELAWKLASELATRTGVESVSGGESFVRPGSLPFPVPRPASSETPQYPPVNNPTGIGDIYGFRSQLDGLRSQSDWSAEPVRPSA